MLKNIKDIFKTMGEALTFANIGEMLTDDQKSDVLFAQHKEPRRNTPDIVLPRVVLAGDEEFSPETVEHAIALCLEYRAILDLLCVSMEGGGSSVHLETVLPRLESEFDLDFQVTRRQGDLLVVTDAYLRTRRDTLMILVNVNHRLRNRTERYRRTGKWFRTTQLPTVQLVGDVFPA